MEKKYGRMFQTMNCHRVLQLWEERQVEKEGDSFKASIMTEQEELVV